jgi:hypothetical protein
MIVVKWSLELILAFRITDIDPKLQGLDLSSLWDRWIDQAGDKATVCSSGCLVGVHELRMAQFYGAVLALGISCGIGHYLWRYWVLIQAYGENWWRGSPAATRGESAISLRLAGLASVTGIVLLFQTLWTSRACFG